MNKKEKVGYMNKVFNTIMSGLTIKDRSIILISLSYAEVIRFLCMHLFKKDLPAYGEFIIRDIIVENEDGIFYCRKKVHDYSFIQPSWEKELREYMNLKEGIFIDVGAHIGKYTVMLGRRINNRGKVIAIEPDHDNYNVLLKNISLNQLKNVIPINVGIWKEKDKLKLYNLDNKNTGMRSIIPDKEKSWSIVDVNTLDNILKELRIERIDLIKIDTEGAEVEVLEGLMKTMKTLSKKPKIIFESFDKGSCTRIKNILEPYNYKIDNIYGLVNYYIAY